MITYTPFTPTYVDNFQFQPTLDGEQYNLIVTWNLSRQDWYINLYTLGGTLVTSQPLIGSPPAEDINLMLGYFTTSTLVYREATQQFEVNP
jgi:hypothetical protein